MDLTCPGRDELSRFAVGNLARGALDRIGEHVSGCARCETVLQELDEAVDPLIDPLRSVGESSVNSGSGAAAGGVAGGSERARTDGLVDGARGAPVGEV
jgi:hypothetical protein